ncbi:GIN domain-containing protein [Algibacter luteus]|uniref:GIN domain-containing protein n=1 Tax=Algibacter luteus TaxID=1178825 RepID=UPI0025987544|nr:DUF2807 domain-containing protein [Algibacter luteus]WJJ96953.1 DUF2807 domain-containing protein [Algibacter luteus]
MKNIICVLVVLFSIMVSAQKKEKIKGNKEVIEVYNNLESFSQIEISDQLEVFLMQTGSEGYSLKTDSNLINSIKLEVIDSILKVYTTRNIVSNKKLELNITFQKLNKISLSNKAKLKGNNMFRLEALAINSLSNSDFELDIVSNDVSIRMDGNSNGKLKLNGEALTMVLNDNAFIKGSVSLTNFNLTVNKRADLNIEGSCDNLNLIATGSSDIKAKNLKATNAVINGSNTSDIYVYSSKNLNVYAKGKTFVYVYGNPEIKVEGLNDKSQIIKK